MDSNHIIIYTKVERGRWLLSGRIRQPIRPRCSMTWGWLHACHHLKQSLLCPWTIIKQWNPVVTRLGGGASGVCPQLRAYVYGCLSTFFICFSPPPFFFTSAGLLWLFKQGLNKQIHLKPIALHPEETPYSLRSLSLQDISKQLCTARLNLFAGIRRRYEIKFNRISIVCKYSSLPARFSVRLMPVKSNLAKGLHVVCVV